MSRWPSPAAATFWAALAAGIVARVAYLPGKPLWRDEAWVGTFLRQPWALLIEQTGRPVPLGFAALSKLMDALPRLSPEVALRLVPLMAGCLAMPALYALARRLGATSTAALATLWLTAGAPVLIHYSRELKSYAVDLLLAVAVPWLVLRLIDSEGAQQARPGEVRARRVALLGALAAAPWLSFGAFFPIAATLLWVGKAWARRQLGRPWLLAVLVFTASLGAAYGVSLERKIGPTQVRQDWSTEMVPPAGPPWRAPLSALGEYVRVSGEHLLPAGLLPAALLAAVVGAVTWPRPRRGFVLWLFGGTAVLATAAALAGLYPITQGRLLLFAAPFHLLLMGRGLEWLTEAAGRALRRRGTGWAGVAAAAAVASYGAAESVWHRLRPWRSDVSRYYVYDVLHDVEPLIDRLDLLARPGEPVMTSRYSGEQFRFYSRGRLPQTVVCQRSSCPVEGPRIREWLAGVDGHGWMILLDEEDRPWRRRFVRELGFDVRDATTTRGGVLWEVRRRRTAAPPAPSASP